MRATEGKGFGAPAEDGLTCATAEALVVRSAVRELDPLEGARLTRHLSTCQVCRLAAIENAEFVASIRSLNDSMGTPSRHFGERLRARIAIERALSAGRAVNASPSLDVQGRNSDSARGGKTAANPKEGKGRVVNPLTPTPWVWTPARREIPNGRRGRRTLILSSPTLWGSRPAALWLAAGLVVSITLNFLWVSQVVFQSESTSIVRGAEVSDAPAPLSKLADSAARLDGLRSLQDSEGLISSDATATAWWLIAESRARHSRDSRASSASSVRLTFESVERAQAGLLNSFYETSKARAIAALSLVESAEAFGAGDKAAIARFLGVETLQSAANLARDQLRMWTQTPGRAANYSLDGAERAASQNRLGAKGRDRVKGSSLTLAALASGNAHGVFAYVLPEIASADDESRSLDLTGFRPGSVRAEALCAAAAVSALD